MLWWKVEYKIFGVQTAKWKERGIYTDKSLANEICHDLEMEGFEVRLTNITNINKEIKLDIRISISNDSPPKIVIYKDYGDTSEKFLEGIKNSIRKTIWEFKNNPNV